MVIAVEMVKSVFKDRVDRVADGLLRHKGKKSKDNS